MRFAYLCMTSIYLIKQKLMMQNAPNRYETHTKHSQFLQPIQIIVTRIVRTHHTHEQSNLLGNSDRANARKLHINTHSERNHRFSERIGLSS